ncbi:MAG TPA: glycosyltransferase [Pseudolabrys sp.]|nr:glycosyltransferase [Pseudolabrys sp.]
MSIDVIAGIALAIWVYLITARGGFWMGSVRDDSHPVEPSDWPAVTVVIPARDEASLIGKSVSSLLDQNYPGPLSVIVIDDDSRDGTAEAACRAARAGGPTLRIVRGQSLPPGWTGKLWAMKQGIVHAMAQHPPPEFLLLTDADIAHAPDSVRWLVSHARAGGYTLVSLMAKLRCASLAERLHVPAFIYFFQMLYPFRWVAQAKSATAAAAGGCMLVRADALSKAGGIDGIRHALIDDCALAAKMKMVGPIWLGLTERAHSLRPYDDFTEVRHMISRSAYAQLRYSPWLLLGTTLAMLLVFVAPPALTVFAQGFARWLGLAAWVLMAVSFIPTLRSYRQSSLWAVALPAIALIYTYYTLYSAYQHARRRGGQWKGRVQANAAGP